MTNTTNGTKPVAIRFQLANVSWASTIPDVVNVPATSTTLATLSPSAAS